MKKRIWYKGKVLAGDRGGRKIGYPTVNLDPENFKKELKEGVYEAFVKYKNKLYKGALYFGPRLVKNEKRPVLEIHILDFSKEIYGETLEFKIGKFIRNVMPFASMESLKNQMKVDIENILRTGH